MNPAILLKLIPDALKLLAGKFGPSGGEVLRDAATMLTARESDPEMQRALAELDLEKLKVDAGIVESAETTDRVMIASEDKYVSRARPTGLYIYYLVTLAITGGLLWGKQIDPTAILTLVGPLTGTAAFYIHKRTMEKMA
jgi:CRISPR/Cas system-associated protein Csm6